MTQRDEYGRTALHYAAAHRDLDAVRRVLSTENVNARDNNDWTPLHLAAQAASPVVALLLDSGADIDAVTDKGMPAIYWAIMSAETDPIGMVRLLRGRGADPTKATMKSYFGPKSLAGRGRVDPDVGLHTRRPLRAAARLVATPARRVHPGPDSCSAGRS